MDKIFTQYYFDRFWSSLESVSGRGSELQYTQKLRYFLEIFFHSNGIRSVIDAPCGDFNWMLSVMNSFPNIDYCGIDIVKPLVIRNETFYGSQKINFQCSDICSSDFFFSDCDFLLSRDFLFHLSFEDIYLFLNKISTARAKYVAITNHPLCIENSDISTGGYRDLNLFLAPLNCLPDNIIARCDDYIEGFPVRELVIFDGKPIFGY